MYVLCVGRACYGHAMGVLRACRGCGMGMPWMLYGMGYAMNAPYWYAMGVPSWYAMGVLWVCHVSAMRVLPIRYGSAYASAPNLLWVC